MNRRNTWVRLPAEWGWQRSFYRGATPALAAATCAVTLQALLGLPIGWLLRHLFERGERPWFVSVGLAGGALLLYVAGDLLLLSAAAWNLRLTKRAITAMRGQVMDALTRHRIADPGQPGMARLHAGLVHDADRVDEMSAALIGRILPAGMSLAVLFGVLGALNVALFGMTLAVLPFSWIVTRKLRRAAVRRLAALHGDQEGYSAGVLGILERLDLSRIHGAERAEREVHAALADRLSETGRAFVFTGMALGLLQNEAAVLTSLVILLGGQVLISGHRLDYGTLLASTWC